MTSSEKDLFIAKDILEFNCFCRNGGTDWYEGQYSLGHWRYSTRLEDALDMFKRVIGEDRHAHIIMGKDKYECHVIREGLESIMVNLNSNSLPDLLCLIAIHLKGNTVHTE
jgi:hypothetical protein